MKKLEYENKMKLLDPPQNLNSTVSEPAYINVMCCSMHIINS